MKSLARQVWTHDLFKNHTYKAMFPEKLIQDNVLDDVEMVEYFCIELLPIEIRLLRIFVRAKWRLHTTSIAAETLSSDDNHRSLI